MPVPKAGAATACPACEAPVTFEDGVVVLTAPAEDRDYPEDLVALIADVEERHFWFAARNDAILSTMRRVIGSLAQTPVLDVGCGTGFVLAALEAAGMRATGIDMHLAALRLARARVRGPLFLSDAAALPFLADFDVVTLFDVIEHAVDDVGVLRQAARVLTPGGHVVVTAPAGPDLWTPYDDAAGHKRRYDRGMLVAALEGAGFAVAYAGYFNCLPLIAQTLYRRIVSPAADGATDAVAIVRQTLRVPPTPLNAAFGFLMRLEAPLRRLSWVRGGSLVAVARVAP